MNHEPRPPPVARPLALVVTGGREEAVALEEALRRYFAAGLERLADDEAADPRAALEALLTACQLVQNHDFRALQRISCKAKSSS